MPENTVNPNLRLSSEKGYEDADRADQVRGNTAYDWRDWLNHIEYKTLSDVDGMTLAKSRFDNIKVQPDIEVALITFKLTVMKARVSHDQPYSPD